MREFKYYPEAFGKLPVKTIHMDLIFDMHDDHTVVSNDFRMKALQDITELKLDAKNMEVQGCYLYTDLDKKEKQPLTFKYEKENDKLVLSFSKTISIGTEFVIRTETTCRPTNNILEGLYYDETPAGAPPTQITQCQQWGFQRLVPCFDDMTAKCTYTTTIIADSTYTNFLSNGDPAPECTDEKGNPKPLHLGKGRAKMIYHNHTTPMAPYLFFLGVGTYATFTKPCEYPDGKSFRLELLAPLGSDPKVAEQSLEITRQAILWIHKYSGYQYTGKVYREIGMQNSDIGGMENVGNTTIITNAIMPTPFMDDSAYEYMLRVKVHEFYHNLNGSEVTGTDPFQIWLNEAVTVHAEQDYWAQLFGEDYVRIQCILMLYAPMTGIFDQDNSPAILPIIPQGFNSANELITSVTYVKAPEFIRMIELLIGKDAFKKGLARYYQRFKHINATSQDWIQAMEEVSNMELQQMADGWLKRPRYPTLTVKTHYENNQYTIELEQGEAEAWQFPVCLALVDQQGKDIPGTSQTCWMKNQKEKITYPVKEKPAYVSLNRGHSFYGKIKPFMTPEQLSLQVLTDSDVVNRYMAFQELLEQEKMRLINDLSLEVRPSFAGLFGKVLQDDRLDVGVKGFMLRIADMIRDDTQSHKYQAIYDATKKIKKTLAEQYKDELSVIYHDLASSPPHRSELSHEVVTIKNRRLKTTCIDLLASLETKEVYELLLNQLNSAVNYPDRYTALRLYLKTQAPDRVELARSLKDEFTQSPVSWESYLSTIGSMEGKEAIALIQETAKDHHYRIEQAPQQRALYMNYALNRKLSLLTPEGLDYLTTCLLQLGRWNEMTTFRMLSAFNQLNQLDSTHQVPIVEALLRILEAIPLEESASVHNTVRRLLKGSPKAVKAHEEKTGKKLTLS